MTVFDYFYNPKILSQGDKKINPYNSLHQNLFNLCEKGLSIILFFCEPINNFMRKSQDIKKLQIESVFLNQVLK